MILIDPLLLNDERFEFWSEGFKELINQPEAQLYSQGSRQGDVNDLFFKHPSTTIPSENNYQIVFCVSKFGYEETIKNSLEHEALILSDRLPDELPIDTHYDALSSHLKNYHYLGPYISDPIQEQSNQDSVLVCYDSREQATIPIKYLDSKRPIEDIIIPTFHCSEIMDELGLIEGIKTYDLSSTPMGEIPWTRNAVICTQDPQLTLYLTLKAMMSGAQVAYCMHQESSVMRYFLHGLKYPSLLQEINFIDNVSLKTIAAQIKKSIQYLKDAKSPNSFTPNSNHQKEWLDALIDIQDKQSKVDEYYKEALSISMPAWDAVKKMPEELPLRLWSQSPISHRVVISNMNDSWMESLEGNNFRKLLLLKLHSYRVNEDFSMMGNCIYQFNKECFNESLSIAHDNLKRGLHPESAYLNHAEIVLSATSDNALFPYSRRSELLKKACEPIEILIEQGGYLLRSINMLSTLLFSIGEKEKAVKAIQTIYSREGQQKGLITKSVLKFTLIRKNILSREDPEESQIVLNNALSLFNQELKLEKEIDSTLLNLPIICATLGHAEDAITHARQAIESYPDRSHYMISKVSFWLWMDGHHSKSQEVLKLEQSQPNEDSRGILMHAISSILNGQVNYGVSFLKEKEIYLKDQPQSLDLDIDYWALLGLLFSINKEDTLAKRYYQKAMQINPLNSTFQRAWSKKEFPVLSCLDLSFLSPESDPSQLCHN